MGYPPGPCLCQCKHVADPASLPPACVARARAKMQRAAPAAGELGGLRDPASAHLATGLSKEIPVPCRWAGGWRRRWKGQTSFCGRRALACTPIRHTGVSCPPVGMGDQGSGQACQPRMRRLTPPPSGSLGAEAKGVRRRPSARSSLRLPAGRTARGRGGDAAAKALGLNRAFALAEAGAYFCEADPARRKKRGAAGTRADPIGAGTALSVDAAGRRRRP